ncbi:MAG: HD domain-containing protein [Anaerolineae bacterium]|nr:HD domain-containing protein [Anaerolineae bacterium]RIK16744.1 MAG: phosphohydrolase [Anaerolineae bacterium]
MNRILIEDVSLARQIDFLIEMDKLKGVERRSPLVDGSRLENSAEHSWHLALMAMTLVGQANEPVDLARVVRMLLLHDIVEIDAGDTYAYDVNGNLDKADREQLAATRLFGLLPANQTADFRVLWEEFEARTTPEARFANALDRFMPLLHNYLNDGWSWREHGVTAGQIRRRMEPVAEGSAALGDLVEAILADSLQRGLLPDNS